MIVDFLILELHFRCMFSVSMVSSLVCLVTCSLFLHPETGLLGRFLFFPESTSHVELFRIS